MFSVNAFLQLVTSVLGFLLGLAITLAVIWFIRAPLKRVLQQLIGDKAVAEAATQFVVLLLGLYGLRGTLAYINQAQANQFFGRLMDLLLQMAGVIQWVANVAALLFIGYSLQARRNTPAEDEA